MGCDPRLGIAAGGLLYRQSHTYTHNLKWGIPKPKLGQHESFVRLSLYSMGAFRDVHGNDSSKERLLNDLSANTANKKGKETFRTFR